MGSGLGVVVWLGWRLGRDRDTGGGVDRFGLCRDRFWFGLSRGYDRGWVRERAWDRVFNLGYI